MARNRRKTRKGVLVAAYGSIVVFSIAERLHSMGSPLYFPKFRAFDANGNPLASGKVYTYVAGTSTPLATYSDGDLTTENANPVVLDANGEASIFGVTNQNYKVVLKTSADVTQWTIDDISLGSSDADLSPYYGTNFIDNGGMELFDETISRPSATASGAGSTCIMDRWWGYRGGATGYTVSGVAAVGYPNAIKLSRDSANASTTSISCGQHIGGITATGYWTNSDVITAALAQLSQTLICSAYFKTGANFSGSGVTIEIVSNSTTQNVLSGTGWTVEASASLVASQLSSSSYTRLSVAKTGALNGSNRIVGVRFRFDSPSGTAGAADYVYVTGCKLELATSSAPTAYVIPTMNDTRTRCGLWWRRWGDKGNRLDINGYGDISQNYDVPVPIWPPMIPGVAATVNGTWGVTNCSQPTITGGVNGLGFMVRLTVTALGAFAIVAGSSDSITLDAEIA